jgi:hypothetical protein
MSGSGEQLCHHHTFAAVEMLFVVIWDSYLYGQLLLLGLIDCCMCVLKTSRQSLFQLLTPLLKTNHRQVSHHPLDLWWVNVASRNGFLVLIAA